MSEFALKDVRVATTSVHRGERLAGLLLGTAVGDALGLPAENLSPEKIRKRWRGQWRMRFIFGKGMVSDDTEHMLMVAQALLEESENADEFQRVLAWKLRWWFAALPGGVGLATARACIKLWLGFPPSKAAAISAGSGPAMRSAIIGAYFAKDAERRRAFVVASTRLTHRSWQADAAAVAVAECAALAVREGESFLPAKFIKSGAEVRDCPPSPRPSPPGEGDTSSTGGEIDAAVSSFHDGRESFLQSKTNSEKVLGMLGGISAEAEWQKIVSVMRSSLAAGESVEAFVQRMNLRRGVTGYSLHVVPVAIYAWVRHAGDFRSALVSALDCGGDTDTVGAIVGALAGASVGKAGIPAEWVNNIWEWPRSVGFMEEVAERLAEETTGKSEELLAGSAPHPHPVSPHEPEFENCKGHLSPALSPKGGEGEGLARRPASGNSPPRWGRGRKKGPVKYFGPGVVARNLVFLVVVLGHGFRRLLPPY